MRYSIIIPTLNEELYLPRLLTSVTQEKRNDIEVIIVDGGSNDKTQSVARRFGNRMSLRLLTLPHPSLPKQRNIGAAQATGQWYIFADADTELTSSFFSSLDTFLSQHTDAFLTTYCRPDSDTYKDRLFGWIQNTCVTVGVSLGYPVAPGSLAIIKREAFRTIGGYNEGYAYAEDVDISKRMKQAGYPLTIIRKPLYVWSLRRFRTYGYLRTYATWAKTILHTILTGSPQHTMEHYSMGGHNFSRNIQPKKSSSVIQ